ncbi:MAG: HsdM family class I SAM-dependent methyltransferase, partial [Gemmatimonadales bacterium]
MKARTAQFQAASLHGIEPPQLELMGGDLNAPETLPTPSDLQPTRHLSALLERCSNFIYANDGRLKEKAFQEVAKLLFAKLWEERHHPSDQLRFGVTAKEFSALRRSEQASFTDRIARVFADASAKHPTLFSPGESLHLRPLTLAYVVNQLQLVDLSNTSFDIKGLAFQRLVSAAQRGARGEYFTPDPVVRLAVELLRPKADDRVLDPACGSGGFLLATMRYAAHRFPATDIGAYAKTCLRGIDFNPDIARVARLQLAFYCDSEDSILAENALLPYERVSDSGLASGTSGLTPESFDIVVTNPPFGKKGRVIDNTILAALDLGHRWSQRTDGEWIKLQDLAHDESPEVLFIERCAGFLRPGGRMAIVLPDGILQNPSAGYVRKWVLDHLKALAVVSLPQETFVPFGTGIKTSLAIFEKPAAAGTRSAEESRSSVFFARVEQIGYDVKGNPVFERDEHGRILTNGDGQPRIAEDVTRIAQLFADHSAGTLAGNRGDQTFTVQHALL